jgi:pimeloyl-ACP methyl ester carboxylesterase
VVGDYLRIYGEAAVGGLAFIGGLPGPDELTPWWDQIKPGLLSESAAESNHALAEFVRSLVHRSLEPEEFFLLLGWNAAVPPAVRRALLDRPAPSAPLPRITAPVWLLHGLEDRLVLPPSDARAAEFCPHAVRTYYPDAGHAPFWDQPDRFNAELAAFARSL